MNKKEWIYFIVSVIVLIIVFGFDDGSTTFSGSHWGWNLLEVVLLVIIVYGAYIFAQKLVASRHNAHTEYSLWMLGHLRWKTYMQKDNRPRWPVGIVIAVVLTLLTVGKFYFTALGSSIIKSDKVKRTGRKYTNVSEYESALILLAGPLAVAILLFIGNWLYLSGFSVDNLVVISLFVFIWNFVPFPGIDGSKILSYSRPAYIFALVVFLLAFALKYSGFGLAVLFTILIALIIMGLYFYKWEK